MYDERVTPTIEELGTWDAVETSARIRRGDVSRREVAEAERARAEARAELASVTTL